MKTYSEEETGEVVDWNAYLDRVEKGEVGYHEALGYKELANSWITCACGNQCSVIPRDELGRPYDDILNIEGSRFYAYISGIFNRISDGHPSLYSAANARKALKAIEERAAVLIKEIQDAEVK